MLSRFAAVAAVAVVLGASPARAAPADPTEGLRVRLEALDRALAELPAALDSLHEVQNRLSLLSAEVERLGAARAADPDVRQAIDELRTQVSDLERRLALAQLRALESATASPSSSFAYDDALVFRASPVELKLNATLQPRYTAVLRSPPRFDRSGFQLHHGELQLGAVLLGWIELVTMLDFGADYVGDGRFAPLRDAYLAVRPVSWLRVRAGQMKVPFGRQRLVSSLRQTFVERSLATLAFTFDRDLGGVVEATPFGGRLLVQAAVTDGVLAGPRSHNDNLDLAYTVRVLAQPFGPVPLVEGDRARSRRPAVSIGGALQYDLQPTDAPPPLNDLNLDGVVDNIEVWSAEAEAAAHWLGFAVEGEYFFRRERPGFKRPDHDYYGYYVQGSAMVWRGLQLAARFSYAQPHPLGGGKLGVFGDQPAEGLEAAGVANWFVWGERAKVQVGYAYRRDRPAADAVDRSIHEGHVIEVQLQAGF
jgi:uncharacterized small protein (DUF1192 family)